jgi:hypothetical protein
MLAEIMEAMKSNDHSTGILYKSITRIFIPTKISHAGFSFAGAKIPDLVIISQPEFYLQSNA